MSVLASEFYEALKHELRQTSSTNELRRRTRIAWPLQTMSRVTLLEISPQRVHPIDHAGGLSALRPLDWLASLLLLEQLLERIFVFVLKLLRREVPSSRRCGEPGRACPLGPSRPEYRRNALFSSRTSYG
jgi:hypothetical protein